MRRWLRRILYGLLILIIVALAAVQVVLWTDWPRRLVLSLVQQQLGLRVEASGLSTGWMGTTTLRDVRLSLPLAGESFLDMPTMTIHHTALLPLAITRDFELRTIELNKPNLVVRRDSAGRWNLQDVAELVARATAGTPAPGTKQKPPKLPTLRLTDGTIAVIDDLKKTKMMITPVNATGDPKGPLVWQYSIAVPQRLAVNGQVAPGEEFKHEFAFHAEPREWIGPWVANLPSPLSVDGKWNGILVNKKAIAGRLEIQKSEIAKGSLRGKVGVQTSGDEAIISPQNLIITTGIPLLPEVQLASGTVLANGPALTRLTLQQIRLGAVGGLAQLDGSADLVARTAEFAGVWQELALGTTITHSGNFNLQIKNLFPNKPSINATVVTRGKAAQGAWDSLIKLEGVGRDWEEMDWIATIPRIEWKAKLPLDVRDITLNLSTRSQVISLNELHWPAADRITASGKLDLGGAQDWNLRARGGGTLRADSTVATDRMPFDFNIESDGSFKQKRVHLTDLFVRARNANARLKGNYVVGSAEPLSMSLFLNREPDAQYNEGDLPVRGKFASEAHVGGTIDPINLMIKGIVRADNFVVLDHKYGNIRGAMSGLVTPDKTALVIADLSLLGGEWKISGIWPYDEKDKLTESNALRIEVNVQHLGLHDVGELLKIPDLDGKSNGRWTIDITKPRRDLVAMRGELTAENVSMKGIVADRMTAKMKLERGELTISPIELHRKETGVATGEFDLTLASPKTPKLQLNVENWPLPLAAGSSASAAMWGDIDVRFGADDGATGTVKARTVISSTRPAVAEAITEGSISGRVLTLSTIKLKGVGGEATGSATINGRAPNQSVANLTWNGVQGENIAALVPQLSGLKGAFSGALTIDPAASADRPVEPLRIRVEVNPDKAAFRTVALGPAKLSAFVNLGENFALKRGVLDELPAEDAAERTREASLDDKNIPANARPLGWNDFRLADGRLKLWARRGRHSSGEMQTHIIVDFTRLDLQQLVHAFKEAQDPMPGRLSGQIILHGASSDLDGVIADGRVRITDSDLAKSDILETLYNAMSLGSQPKEPNGEGRLDITLQRSTLSLNHIHYFNRGVEALSDSLTISDVWHMPHVPIQGFVVGTARPLSAIKLPFMADVDQILSVLQSNLTTVKVGGFVDKPDARVTAFDETSSGLKRFLTGQMNETRGAPPPAR